MKLIKVNFILFAFFALSNYVHAADILSKEPKTQDQREFERSERQVNREYDRQMAESTRESMRDKTHDGGVKVNKDTSVGVSKDGVYLRKSTN